MIQKCTNGIEDLAEFHQFCQYVTLVQPPHRHLLHKRTFYTRHNVMKIIWDSKGWNEDVGFLPILVSSPWFDRPGRWIDAIFFNVHRAYETAAHQRRD